MLAVQRQVTSRWALARDGKAYFITMPINTYILCPGQGAQVVGMGKDFYESSPAAKEVFDIANER